jgi:hypothetical protein
VHWCRRRVRFNEVPVKVPKVPEKVWKVLVQSRVRFHMVPEKVPEKVWEARCYRVRCGAKSGSTGFRVPKKIWEALVQSRVRFHRVPGKKNRKGLGALVQS